MLPDEPLAEPLGSFDLSMLRWGALDLGKVFESITVFTETKLDNTAGVQFSGDSFVGSKSSEQQTIFDTGSSQVWFYSKDRCAETRLCPSRSGRFDEGSSTSF